MSDRYYIETGAQRWQQLADDHTDAVVRAFKRRPPNVASILTRCKRAGKKWEYISTAAMLKDAGYKVMP
jgi:hypothetical protein